MSRGQTDVHGSSAASPVPTYRRYTALDGLRGLAALIVVVHHALLVSPALAATDAPISTPPESGWPWWLTSTPLHLVWAGTEAVQVFFVLSGFVLVLPFLSDRPMPWRSYYPRRLIRLYLPVWASVAFAALLLAAWPVGDDDAGNWWIGIHGLPLDLSAIWHELVLLAGTNGLNSPLWSLRWEVVFSLLLPAYVFAARWSRRSPWLALAMAAGAGGTTVVGAHLGVEALVYLPMFALGALLAANRTDLEALVAAIPGWGRGALVVLALLALTASSSPIGGPAPIAHGITVLAAAVLVLAFLEVGTVRRLGDAGLVQWLGKRSFSLYLIHEPIVVAVAVGLPTTNALVALAITLPLSLLVAAGFFRLVEQPAHRLATRVGRASGDRRARVVAA